MIKNILTKEDLVPASRNDPRKALNKLVDCIEQENITKCDLLDVGGGKHNQKHATIFKKTGINAEVSDIQSSYRPTYCGDFVSTSFPKKFDAVWCSHTLEHVRNVGIFIDKIVEVTKENGYIAIIVPGQLQRPDPSSIVGGHLTWWNAGLLLYNIIISGVDCSQAKVLTDGYNVCVIVRNIKIKKMPKLYHDSKRDIILLNPYFPLEAHQGFDGNINMLNW